MANWRPDTLSLEWLDGHGRTAHGTDRAAFAKDALALGAGARLGGLLAEIGDAVFEIELGDLGDEIGIAQFETFTKDVPERL